MAARPPSKFAPGQCTTSTCFLPHIVWINDNTITVSVNEDDRVHLEIGPKPYGIVLVADRYQLHKLIIEIDRQLSRYARH